MKWHACSLLPALLTFATVARGLLVIGPQKLRTNRRYTMVMSNSLSYRVNVLLTLTDGNNGTEYVKKTADVLQMRNQLVEFDVPDGLEAGTYTLTLKGQRGFSFNEEIDVEVTSKSISGLIQLDKPVFKPGETVQFRVIVLDSDLRPPKNLRSVSVDIENSKGLNVRKLDAAELKIGVYEGSFKIAPSPDLGTYKIIVASGAEELVSKTFEVKEYVLSTFDVDVSTTTVPLEEHGGLHLTVSAKNVFGQPVRGNVHLIVFSTESLLEVKATRPVDGVAQLFMRFNRPLHIHAESKEVNLNFTFTELHTNRSITKSLQFTVYKTKYTAKLNKDTPLFLSGKTFTATVKVEHRDGSAARYVHCTVEAYGLEDTYNRTFVTDENGQIHLELMPSESDTISITVLEGENQLLEEEIQKAVQHTEAFLSIAFKSGIQQSKPIKLQVTCKRTVKFLVYYVLSRGNVIDQGFISSTISYRINIELKYSHAMVPMAKVFVATVINNTVVYAIKDIVFQDFLNHFDMEVENTDVKPGDPIQLKMIGRPESYVALAAYDKSLLQYGSTHDLHWSDVQQVYKNFHEIDNTQFDFFQSIGLFARVSSGITLNIATSKNGRGGLLAQSSRLVPVRTNFAESFLWRNAILDSSGRLNLEHNTPHTTTAWCLTGFSVHPTYGLGIIKNPLQLNTVKAFYIVDHLPYSIKQDEVVTLQFTIFNNLGADYSTEVMLENVQNQFEFVASSPNDKMQSKIVMVKQTAPASVSFLVKAKKLGEMVVRVQAANELEMDKIQKVIRVMPKSLVETGIETRLFMSTNYSKQTFELAANIDKRADAGSVKLTFVVEPNMLSGVMENLNKLIAVPTGSGESSMIHFVPHVAVLDFLTTVNRRHPDVEKTKNLLSQGYQDQLKFRLTDGSYKDFGGTNSSIFLTAFVAKSMQTAAKYLPEVDKSMVNQAYKWLESKQHRSGRFEEVGPTLLQHLQTNARKSIALTSYVLIAFLENPNTKETYSSVIENGINYVLNHSNDIEDPFDLAIATYALSLHDSESNRTATVREKLISKGILTEDNSAMYWPRETHEVETTAYALLAIVKAQNLIHNGILAMRWLVNQRHVTGSFPRTQDTFVGLQALAELIEIIKLEKNEYEIDLKVSRKNAGAEQKITQFVIGPHETRTKEFAIANVNTRKVKVTVGGRGFGLVSLKYEYSLDLRNFNYRFNMTLEKQTDSNNQLVLKICASFIPKLADERSDKTLVEVNFPSGYAVDTDPISQVTGGRPVKKDIRFGATSVVLYYENMGTENNCFVVTAHRIFTVSMRRDAYVLVHDFYNPNYNALRVYGTAEDL